MATAKGLCYALEIPLISIDTLILMAKAAMEKISFEQMPPGFLLVPMIDARRMEVFTAVIDQALNFTWPTQAMVLEASSFAPLSQYPLVFFGNGSEKVKNLIQHAAAFFEQISFNATDMIELAYDRYSKGNFTELAYSEPLYTKAFYTPDKKK
jgi:tRNA threonylcarbamoyladenosine biosynthesis protein TsaB